MEAILQELTSSGHQPTAAPTPPDTLFSSVIAAGFDGAASASPQQGSPLGSLDPMSSLPRFSLATEIAEVVRLCAVDGELFGRTFFPKTFRQPSPKFHTAIWDLLNSAWRLINIQVFRGGAKTTLLRTFIAHRIAYGLSHTILVVGKSEAHAVRSLRWIKRQIQSNARFTSVYDLRAGDKWADNEITINHGIDEYPITLLAMGLSGSIRGVNIDDYRPDLIVIDDILDEENAATEEQRKKIAQLVLGGLVPSLTPRSEDEAAKLVMLQTPQDAEDLSMTALSNPLWKSARFPIWSLETEDLAVEEQESAWPERWTSAEVRADKLAAIDTNTYSIWARENELRPIKSERLAFRPEWKRYYDEVPQDGFNVIAIDPVPPPSAHQLAKGLVDKDYEAIVAVRVAKGGYYVLEARQHRGHSPEWTISTFLELAMRYNPRNIYVEAIAYQRVLSWILQQAMLRQGRFWAIRDVTDMRKKYTRILDALHGPATNQRLFFARDGQQELKAQFDRYPDVGHDDLLDALATAITQTAMNFWQDAEEENERPIGVSRDFKPLLVVGDAP